MAIQIRAAVANDASALRDILKSTFERTWYPALTPQGLQHARDINIRLATYVEQCWPEFVVAERQADVIGMMHWRNNFLEALHLKYDQQNRGVGTLLLRTGLDEIRNKFFNARLETDSFNVQARSFYKKHGFVEIDTYPDEEWQSGFTTVLMEKPLK